MTRVPIPTKALAEAHDRWRERAKPPAPMFAVFEFVPIKHRRYISRSRIAHVSVDGRFLCRAPGYQHRIASDADRELPRIVCNRCKMELARRA